MSSLINKLLAPAGYRYISSQGIFDTRTDSFLKNFGYFTLYDVAAPFALMFLDCEPVRFKYDNRHWNFEFWKGRYGAFIGAEIGVYTGTYQFPIAAVDHRLSSFLGKDTKCATKNDWLEMSFVLKKNGRKLFENNSDDKNTAKIEKHWWLTGFKFDLQTDRSSLVNEITIVFKDLEMLKAFAGALKRMGYTDSEFTRWDEKRTIKVIFGVPHSPQPGALFSLDKVPSLKKILEYMKKVFVPLTIYSIVQIGEFLLSVYKMSAELLIEALSELGFAMAKIVSFVGTKLKKSAEAIVKILRSVGYSITEIANYFKTKLSREELSKLLKKAGYLIHDIGSFFKSIFRSSDVSLAKIFRTTGYTAGQIGSYFKNILKKNAPEIAIILAGAGFAATTIKTIGQTIFGGIEDGIDSIVSIIS